MRPTTAQADVSWGVIDVEQGRWEEVLGVLAAAGGGRTLAVMQPDANVLVALSRQFEIPAIYLRAEDLLADRAVNAVYIGSPVRHRAEVAAWALDAGKHVLVEAPVATSVAGFGPLMEAAARHPELVTAVATAPRHATALRATRELVRSGSLGRIVQVRALLVEADAVATALADDADGGSSGLLWDLAYRCLDAITYLVDAYPVAASSTIGPFAGDGLPVYAEVTFTLSDGALATIQCIRRSAQSGTVDSLELHGAQGSATLTGGLLPATAAQLVRDRAGRHPYQSADQSATTETFSFETEDLVSAPVSDFLAAIAGAVSEPAALAHARSLTAALEAAMSSAREGRLVPVTRAGEPR